MHSDTVAIMKKPAKGKGIKEMSALAGLEYFDMIDCFGIDDLHSVFEEVFTKILKLFYKSTTDKEYHIPTGKQTLIDKRLLAMKPTKDITRKPRSIVENIEKLKGNEKRSLLFYYLPIILEGIHQKKYVDNLSLLSFIIYTYSI